MTDSGVARSKTRVAARFGFLAGFLVFMVTSALWSEPLGFVTAVLFGALAAALTALITYRLYAAR